MSKYRLLVVFALLLLPRLSVAGDNAVQDELGLKKAEYTAAIEKCQTDFLAAFDSKIQEIAKSGHLENVKNLLAEKKAFEADGKTPVSQTMKAPLADFQSAMKKAHDGMMAVYEKAVREYTKALEIDKAEAVNAELDAFKKKAVSKVAPVAQKAEVPIEQKKSDLAAFEKSLNGTIWEWDTTGSIKFQPDATVFNSGWSARGLVTSWKVIDRRTVLLCIERGRIENRYAILTFSLGN